MSRRRGNAAGAQRSASYDAIVNELPRLTSDECRRLSERLKAMNSLAPAWGGATAGGARESSAVDEVLEAIVHTVLHASGEKVAPSVLRRAADGQALRTKSADLSEFLSKHAPDRTHRRALLRIGFRLLHSDLARAGMTVTSRTLAACCHQIPAVLDRAFPGYAQSGLLCMIVAKEEVLANKGARDDE